MVVGACTAIGPVAIAINYFPLLVHTLCHGVCFDALVFAAGGEDGES